MKKEELFFPETETVEMVDVAKTEKVSKKSSTVESDDDESEKSLSSKK